MTRKEKKLFPELYAPLPLVKSPFIRRAAGGETDILSVLQSFCRKGIIRRFGAVLNHRAAGFKENAMVCWKVDAKKKKEVVSAMEKYAPVSHCYFRKTYRQWPYNFYTMVHARTKKERDRIIREISSHTGCREYRVLASLKEFKKTRPVLEEGGGR